MHGGRNNGRAVYKQLVLVQIILLLGQAAVCARVVTIPQEELDVSFWTQGAHVELEQAIHLVRNTNAARNVIIFIGDGMGVSTVTAARIFKGQQMGRPGEETKLEFERFPNVAFSKTYNVDHQVPDSAATATAFLCGFKAQYGTLGLKPNVQRGDCAASIGQNATCIVQLAHDAGKATGIVTTSRVTHATPAGAYASTPDRMWETDSQLPHHARRAGCLDIASQLTTQAGKSIDVLMGGGRGELLPNETRYHHLSTDETGKRLDGRNIINEWTRAKLASGMTTKYVYDRHSFDKIDPTKTDALIGVFSYSHMKYEVDRERTNNEPSLTDMVDKAIKVLRRNKNGFFLLVEGARIDHAHHANTAGRALEETVSMDEAVKRALQLVDIEHTLVIVTADHSHPLAIGSYARRGNPILGLTDYSGDINHGPLSDIDLLPFPTLTYGNGPGYSGSHPRKDLTDVDTESRTYRQPTAIPLHIVSHDGSDVAIYATGPMAHLFHGVHEQHYIFHVMTYAACLVPNRLHCQCPNHVRTSGLTSQSGTSSCMSGYVVVLMLALIALMVGSRCLV